MSYLTRFCCLLTTLLVALSSPASAEVLLLPSGPIVADGRTPTTVFIQVTDPVEGERFRVRPSRGKSSGVSVRENGLLGFTYVPPRICSPTSVELKVQRRGVSRQDESLYLDLVPPFDGQLGISFQPAVLRGGDSSATIHVLPSCQTPQEPALRTFLLAASAGTVDPAVPAEDGTWIARYTPPSDLDSSRTVIITAADAAAPDRIYGFATLPILQTRSISLQAEPDATATLSVGDRSYGPRKVSPAGTVAFQVEIDPASPQGLLQVVPTTGDATSASVDLPLPDYPGLAFLPLPPRLPANPDLAPFPVRIVVTDAAGRPASGLSPTITASVGEITSPAYGGAAGIYAASFTPPSKPGEVTFTATWDSGTTETTISLVNPLPRIALEIDPPEIPRGKRDFQVSARLVDSQGVTLDDPAPEISAQGASLLSRARKSADGTYTARFRMRSSASQAVVTASPKLTYQGGFPCRVLMWSQQNTVPTDGSTSTSLQMAVVDEWGIPVPQKKLELEVLRGDASVPSTILTGANGMGTAELVAGQQPGLLVVQARVDGLHTEISLLQAPPQQAMPGVETGGDEESLLALNQLKMANPTASVTREDGSEPVGPPATVSITSIPPFTTPGAAILVNLKVLDASGRPVRRPRPSLEASLGTVGSISRDGDGSYSITVQLPAGQDGPVTLTSSAGAVTRSLQLPTLSQAMSEGVMQASDEGGQATPRISRPSNPDQAWLRLRGTMAGVAHTYEMTSSGNADAPEKATFENGDLLALRPGGAPAIGFGVLLSPTSLPIALDADLLAYFEGIAVGDVTYTNNGFSFQASLRYIHPVSRSFSLHAAGGFQKTNALIFRYGDATRSSAQLLQYPLSGFRTALGASFQRGRVWSELELFLTYVPQPLIGGFVIKGSYDITEMLAGYLSFQSDWRSMTFAFEETNEEVHVSDNQQPLMAGLSAVFK